MKKVYFLLSAALLAASASAVEKEAATKSLDVANIPQSFAVTNPVKASAVKAVAAEKSISRKGVRKAADSTYSYAYFRAADGVMALGNSSAGMGYSAAFGFKPVQGDLVFNNYSTNVKSNVWDYAWYENNVEVPYSSTDTELVVESRIGEMVSPVLSVVYNNGATDDYTCPPVEYLTGASAEYWGFGEDGHGGIWGLTFFQNAGYKMGDYNGSITYKTAYSLNEEGYNANGVYVDSEASRGRDWLSLMQKKFETQSITNLSLDNFTIIQPKPLSTYFITKGWLRCNIIATAETQLLSYIYPIDEEGVIAEDAIAIGYAAVSTDGAWPIFEYYPLDEEGDELEGEVYIDTAVAITIEGFQGNEAITELAPASGYYPFSYGAYDSGNDDIIAEPMTYLQLSMDVKGEPTTVLTYDTGLYYVDDDNDDILSMLNYTYFMTDATYAYILSVNGENTVTIPAAGGNAELEIEALYYDIKGLLEEDVYTIDAPEWATVEVSDVDKETGNTMLTISAEASAEARTGVVSLSGFGTSLDITVNQSAGTPDSVEVVKAENGEVYYDLTGRRVVNPEKGVYVKVNGNKSEKVIL